MDVTHSHCPDGCEHPQPMKTVVWCLSRHGRPLLVSPTLSQGFYIWKGSNIGNSWQGRVIEYCGRCWHRFGELRQMVPCTPEVCD